MRLLWVVGFVGLLGCASAMDAAADLSSDDVGTRRSAAHSLESRSRDEELPREAVDAMLKAAAIEYDEDARAWLMLGLGRSGDVRAKEVLDAYARTNDPEERKVASQALQAWSVKRGRFAQNYRFEADWPYGTEAYPARLPEKK